MTLTNPNQRLMLTCLFVLCGFLSSVLAAPKLVIFSMSVVIGLYLYSKSTISDYLLIFSFVLISVCLGWDRFFESTPYSIYIGGFLLTYRALISRLDLSDIFQEKQFLHCVELVFIFSCSVVLAYLFSGSHVNDILPSGSRNAVGAILLVIGSLRYLVCGRSRSIIFMLTGMLIFILGGRTNQFTGVLIILFVLCYPHLKRPIFSIFLVFCLVITAIFLSMGLGGVEIFDLIFKNDAGNSIGLRTSRSLVWAEWYENLDITKLILGYNLAELTYTRQNLNGNPHNSFILIHAHAGVIAIFFYVWVAWRVLNVSLRAFFILMLIIFKGFFDAILFPSGLDLLFILILLVGRLEHAKRI